MTALERLARLSVTALVKARDDDAIGRSPIGMLPVTNSPSVPNEIPEVEREEGTDDPRKMVRDAIHLLEDALWDGAAGGDGGDIELTKMIDLLKEGIIGRDIPVSVKCIIRDSQGRVLLLRDNGTEYWDLPGGHVAEGEVLDDAVRREVFEETALNVTDCNQVDTKLIDFGDRLLPTLFYQVNCMPGSIKVAPGEFLGFVWASDYDLNMLNLGVYKDILIGDESSSTDELVLEDEQEDVRAFNLSDGGDGIAGVGDPMTSEDTFTPVGGGGKKPRRTLKSLVSSREFSQFKNRLMMSDSLLETGDDDDSDVLPTQIVQRGGVGKQIDLVKSYVPRQVYSNNLMVLSKAQDERFIVAGYASPVVVDQEGHRISHSALRDGLPSFMAMDGEYANVNVMHSNLTVGKVLPEYTATDGTTYKTDVDEVGLFCVAEVRTDQYAPPIIKKVINDIKRGELSSFSISGNADNPVFMCGDDGCYYDINHVDFYEITLCKQGVNQDAKFDIVSGA